MWPPPAPRTARTIAGRSGRGSRPTLDLLYALDDGQPHSQKQICEAWAIPKTTVNTVVKACRAAGYITLEPMPDRPRQRQLCLTPAGMAYAKKAMKELYVIEKEENSSV